MPGDHKRKEAQHFPRREMMKIQIENRKGKTNNPDKNLSRWRTSLIQQTKRNSPIKLYGNKEIKDAHEPLLGLDPGNLMSRDDMIFV